MKIRDLFFSRKLILIKNDNGNLSFVLGTRTVTETKREDTDKDYYQDNIKNKISLATQTCTKTTSENTDKD